MFIRHITSSPVPDVLVSAVIFSAVVRAANPQRFRQEQFASGLCGTVFFTRSVGTIPLPPDQNRLRRIDGVTASQRNTRLTACIASTFGHFAGNFRESLLIGQPRIAIAIIGFAARQQRYR